MIDKYKKSLFSIMPTYYIFSDLFDQDIFEQFATISGMSKNFTEAIPSMLLSRINECTDIILNACIFAVINRDLHYEQYSIQSYRTCILSAINALKKFDKDISPQFKPVFCPWSKVQSNIYVTRLQHLHLYKYMFQSYGGKDYNEDSSLLVYSTEAFEDLVISETALFYLKYGFVNTILLRYAVLYLTFKLFSYGSFPFHIFGELFTRIIQGPFSWFNVKNKCGNLFAISEQIRSHTLPSELSHRKSKTSLKRQILDLFRNNREAFIDELNKYGNREDFYTSMRTLYGIGERSLRKIASDHGLTRSYNRHTESAY